MRALTDLGKLVSVLLVVGVSSAGAQSRSSEQFPDSLRHMLGCYEVSTGPFTTGALDASQGLSVSTVSTLQLQSTFMARNQGTVLWGVRDIQPPGVDSLVVFWSASGTDSVIIERRTGLAGTVIRAALSGDTFAGTIEVYGDAQTDPRPRAVARGRRIPC